jgi:ribosomal protein L21E
VHSATGYTPYWLLHGRHPRDPRVPNLFYKVKSERSVTTWLEKMHEAHEHAHAALEKQRQRMLRNPADTPVHRYREGDLVKVSVRNLTLAQESTQTHKFQPLWVGPFAIVAEVNPGAYSVKLPDAYEGLSDVYNVADLRPYLAAPLSAVIEHLPPIDWPAVRAHPTVPVVTAISDRKRMAGRQPAGAAQDPNLIACKYLVLYRDSPTRRWVKDKLVAGQANGNTLIKMFENMYPRSQQRPCDPVSTYQHVVPVPEEEVSSDDEVDLRPTVGDL